MPRFEPRNPDFRRIAADTFGRQQAMRTLTISEARAYALRDGGEHLIATMTGTLMAMHRREAPSASERVLSLTAVSVVLTGIIGAIVVTPLMNRAGITDFRARGFAAGIAAHSIGTARTFQVDAVAGVFSGIAMSLNALVTSFLVPLAVTFLIR